ncbi:BspA family leucine-rich repeat surface protein [Aquimarina sp. 2201CG1-2-11]|uniref:BspA family leucine-rich repeat surface protein n=1 Tax=Aquimarina discodermiae TaxID=3231043 RepID=UPI00346231B2
MAETDYFISTWQTTTANESITIPTGSSDYNFNIDWGDGFNETISNFFVRHIYVNPGIYTIKISGTFPRIYFNRRGDKDKILSVEQWGSIKWESMESAFHGCTKLKLNALDSPDLSLVRSMKRMFAETRFSADINNWDVVNVTDMSNMFESSLFHGDINGWNVSNVTDMSYMFQYASSFNRDLNSWNVSNVTDMSYMFSNATLFNGNIRDWIPLKVTNMQAMFRNTGSFNVDIGNWKVDNAINMSEMFRNASEFNVNLNNWVVTAVVDMSRMFRDAKKFNGDVSNWDVSGVEKMHGMFENTNVFNSDISGWDVKNVTNMNGMFSRAIAFNRNLNGWNVAKVTGMYQLFSNTIAFNGEIDRWNVSNVTNMGRIFAGTKLSQENYDKLLTSWSKLTLKENVPFDAGDSTFCKAAEGRTKLINQFNWKISDKGQSCTGLIDIHHSIITVIPKNVNINKGNSTRIVVQAIGKDGEKLTFGGESVRIGASLGSVRETIDHKNGTYTTILTSQQLGISTVSLYQGEIESQQKALVSFYEQLSCKVNFKIEANQTITEAKGRYRKKNIRIGPAPFRPVGVISEESASRQALISGEVSGEIPIRIEESAEQWNEFIIDIINPSTPVIKEKGFYDLEIMVKGANGKWTDWYSIIPFRIKLCDELSSIPIQIINGGCFSSPGFNDLVYISITNYNGQIENGLILYNDVDLTSPYNGNDAVFTLGGFSGGEGEGSFRNFVNYEFKVSTEGVVYDKQFCAS